MSKEKAIELAIRFMKKSSSRSKVGACLYSKDICYPGFNIETKIHKGYHAEEVSLIIALWMNANMKDLEGIVIVYDFKDDTGIYPACASCRQFLWEFIHPDILVTVVDPKGNILFEDILKNLYPMPYPRKE